MATTPETTRPLSIWDEEAVVVERSSDTVLRVIRNDSSGSKNLVESVIRDLDELSVESFAEIWL